MATTLSISGFIASFWLPESPRYLLSSGQRSEALKAFDKISNVNNSKDPSEENSRFN